MKVGRVIGRAVLSDRIPAFQGGRWLLVSPLGKKELASPESSAWSAAPTPIVYDDLGASVGDLIGYTEGGEATLPFESDMPIDAYNCCIFDRVSVAPEFSELS